MSNAVHIQLTPKAQKIVAKLPSLPLTVLQGVAAAMDKANQFAIATIQRDHMTGRGPFPPEQHKLGVRTGRLRSSVNATPAKIEGQRVDSSIGSNVIYARIHEFGGTIHREAHETKVRLRTDARGNLLRQLGCSGLAIFANRTHKRFKTVEAHVGAYDVNMPERAPVRTGIAESMPIYKRYISNGIVQAWKGLNS